MHSCLKEAAQDNAADARQVKSYIKAVVKKGMKTVSRKSVCFNSNEKDDYGSSESDVEPATHALDFS